MINFTKTKNWRCQDVYTNSNYSDRTRAFETCLGEICQGVYDEKCDEAGNFTFCRTKTIQQDQAEGSCLYMKIAEIEKGILFNSLWIHWLCNFTHNTISFVSRTIIKL